MSYGGYNTGGYGGGYGAPPPSGGGYRGGPRPGGYGGSEGYGGGFSSPAAQGPPPGADPQLWQWFVSVDTDRSGQITAQELERALINGDWTPFDLDTVKLLMTIFDTDRSGTIQFNEFSGLWTYIKDWQNVFRHFDRDRSGSIDANELHQALQQFGFNLSPHMIELVQKKYGEIVCFPEIGSNEREMLIVRLPVVVDIKASATPVPGAAPPGISFDRFVRACVVIKQLTEAFQKIDTDKDGWIQISYEQFMQTVLSLP